MFTLLVHAGLRQTTLSKRLAGVSYLIAKGGESFDGPGVDIHGVMIFLKIESDYNLGFETCSLYEYLPLGFHCDSMSVDDAESLLAKGNASFEVGGCSHCPCTAPLAPYHSQQTIYTSSLFLCQAVFLIFPYT